MSHCAAQVLRVGQLVLLAVPGELTTMSGRRLREAIKAQARVCVCVCLCACVYVVWLHACVCVCPGCAR